jgi:hypothetical protein
VNYADQFQGQRGDNPRQGIYVAEENRITSGSTTVEQGAFAFNLNYLPQQHSLGDYYTTYQQYAPKSWLTDASAVQRETFNTEVLGFNDAEFQGNYLIGASSFVNNVVDGSGDAGVADYSEAISANDYTQMLAGKKRTANSLTSSSSSDSDDGSWFSKINGKRLKEGAGDIVEGGLMAYSAYGTLGATGALNALGSSAIGSVSSTLGQVGLGELAEEGAALLGETAVEVAGAEIGGAALLGAGLATGGLAIGLGLAAYGAYEFAVGLGAPSLGDDFEALGKGLRKINPASWFEGGGN